MTRPKPYETPQIRCTASIATSDIHMDVIRDLRRINSYVSSVAYSVLNEEFRAIQIDFLVIRQGQQINISTKSVSFTRFCK